MKSHVSLSPYVPTPTTGYVVSVDVVQPYALGPQPSLTSTSNGFVMLTLNDQFYSENFAYTHQSIVLTGLTNSALVTNVVANATQSGYSSPAPASSYAYHLSCLLATRSLVDDFPLVPNNITTPVVTSPPVVSSPITTGSISVSGTINEADGTIIQVYVDGVVSGSVTSVSSSAWTKVGFSPFENGDLVKAKATATGKIESVFSNEVTVQDVTAAPVVTSPIYTTDTTVSGTSTESNGTIIQVYVNGVASGSTTTVSSSAWEKVGFAPFVAGDAIKATASAAEEIISAYSNEVSVGTFYVGTAAGVNGGLYKTNDNGATFTKLTTTISTDIKALGWGALTAGMTTPNLFVGAKAAPAKFLRSSDSGVTFVECLAFEAIAFPNTRTDSPSYPASGVMYFVNGPVGTGNYLWSSSANQDAGWRVIYNGVNKMYGDAAQGQWCEGVGLVVTGSSGEMTIVVCSESYGTDHAHFGRYSLSSITTNWSGAAYNPMGGGQVISVSANGDVWLGSVRRGMWKSTDAGSTFVSASAGMTIQGAGYGTGPSTIVLSGGTIFTAGYANPNVVGWLMQVYKSTNYGVSWTSITSGLPSQGGTTFVGNSMCLVGNTLWLGLDSGGLYKSTDGGDNWISSNSTFGGSGLAINAILANLL